MNLLSLDLSTHTGWAYFECGALISVGKFDVKVKNYKGIIKSYSDFPPEYPYNLMEMADAMAQHCVGLWLSLGKPGIVTEHTEGSKHRISQRTLEFIHFALFQQLKAAGSPNIKYMLNSDWRRNVRCYISQWPEMQKYNKEVGKAKKKAKPNKAGAKVAKINGKVVSKWDAKKLSIHISHKLYPDFSEQIDTDDIADAVNLGHAALNMRLFP